MSDLEVKPLAGAMGAEILGIDLCQDLSNETFATIHQAFLDYQVIFFRDQNLNQDDQLKFTSRFGKPDRHPIVVGMSDNPDVIKVVKPAGESASFGTGWHTDNTFFPNPSMATCLFGEEVPPYGGDTLWSNQYLAYEGLSEGLKITLSGLKAVHTAGRAFDPQLTKEKYEGKHSLKYVMSDTLNDEVVHPVIRTHPETGRKCLFVNPMFTIRFDGWSEAESRPLLNYLYEVAVKPDYTCRFRWENGSMALWDNRCTQHYAMDDYQEFRRVMYRVTLEGDQPV